MDPRSSGAQYSASKIPAGLEDKELNSFELWTVAKLIGEPNVWKKVASSLEVNESHLTCIDEKYKECDEKAFQMLRKWKQQSPGQCKARNLFQALKQEGFNEKANKLFEQVNRPINTDGSNLHKSSTGNLCSKQRTTSYRLPEIELFSLANLQSSGLQSVSFEISEELREKHFNTRELWDISKLMAEPNVWKKVARLLGVEERHLKEIDKRNEDCEESVYQMLLKWNEQNPDQCNFRILFLALKQEGFNEKANKLLEQVNLSTNSASSNHDITVSRVNHRTNTDVSYMLKTKSIDSTIDLQSRLKNFYKKSILPSLPWAEEGLEFTVKDFYSRLKLSSTGENINIENIFDSCNDGENRLLIEGQPGIGKTTLLTKLAYDWATDEEYMKQFQLLFVIRLKEIQNKAIERALCEIAKHCGFTYQEQLFRVINSNSQRVLILLDGFDEITDRISRQSALDTLYKQIFPNVTVAVTCRSGMFETKQDDQITCNVTTTTTLKFWDRQIEVVGLDENGIQKLISKILQPNQANEWIKKLKQYSNEFRELCKSPLIVMLIGFLYANGEVIGFESTRTRLYTKILNGLANYSYKKRNEKISENFDLFDGKSNMSALWKDKLINFGNLCLQFIKDSEVKFSDSNVVREIYSLGFLSKNVIQNPFKKENYFEPFHRSFVEYFAAFYVWQLCFISSDEEIVKECINDWHQLYCDSKGTSLILPFVAGMMGSDANELFLKLLPNAQLYNRLQRSFWRIVKESDQSEEVCNSVIQILSDVLVLPPHELYNPKFSSSKFFKKIIDQWVEKKQSSFLSIYFPTAVYGLSLSGYIRTIRIDLNANFFTQELYKHCFSTLKHVQCKHLVFCFEGNFIISKTNKALLKNWLDLKQKIRAEKLFLHKCNSSVCDLLFSCAEDKLLQEVTIIFHFHCYVDNDGKWNLLLNHLLKYCQIHFIEIELQTEINENKLTEVYENFSTSESCILFHFFGGTNVPVVDVKSLCHNGQKHFDFFNTEQLKMTTTNSKISGLKINNLITEVCETDVNVLCLLLNSHISGLWCDSYFIQNLCGLNTKDNFQLYSSVANLFIVLNTSDLDEGFWNYLTNFQNINDLVLCFDECDIIIPDSVIQWLQSLELVSLQLRFQKLHLRVVEHFCNNFQHLRKKNDNGHCFFPSISIVFNLQNEEEELQLKNAVNQALNSLDEEMLTEIIIRWKFASLSPLNSFTWIDKTKFHINFTYLLPDNHSYDWQLYYSLRCFSCDMVTITKRR